MEKYYYDADIGCCAIACGQSLIRVPNGYGDGTFKTYVMDREEFKAYVEEHKQYGIEERNYHEVMYSTFKDARVLNYDCVKISQIKALEQIESLETVTLCILNGTYSVYYNYGKIYFVKERND